MNYATLDPLSKIALLVFRLQQTLSADGDRLTKKWALTSAKWKVLGAIALSPQPLSAAAIGRAMGLSRQAVIKQVHLLLAQGLLVHQTDPNDARAPLHDLTLLGRETYAAISDAWRQRADALSAGIAAADIDTACAVLEALRGALDSTRPAPSAKAGRP